jgi:hypothetical protein
MQARARRVAVLAVAVLSGTASADVHLVRRGDGSTLMFNDVGSGWTVNGRAPSDGYLEQGGKRATPFDVDIEIHAKGAGLDPRLVKSVMLVESNFNPRAVSRKGAHGLMQLMPATAKRYGVHNRFDAKESIRGGVRYLADLLALFRGNLQHALAAYNAGEGAVTRHAGVPPYPETREYVRRAMVAYRGGNAPLLGGGFRGVETGPVNRVPPSPVRIASFGGVTILTNTTAPLERRDDPPLLGRVGR